MWTPTFGGVCPYLGRCDDPENFHAYPTSANCCHAHLPPASIATSYQAETCFGTGWESCPRYKTAQEGTAPPPPSGRSEPGQKSGFLSRRLAVLIILGALLLLALVLFLIFGPDIKIPALASSADTNPALSGTAAVASTPMTEEPTATPTPTLPATEPIPTRTATTAPTSVPTATATPRPSVTASATPTRAPTQIPSP